jgi:hypothetical protein
VRPAGAGAFFDFAVGVETRNPGKLQSSRLARRWGKAPLLPALLPVEPKEPVE